MKPKIKFGIIAILKVLVRIVLAISLVAVFAFEQKESKVIDKIQVKKTFNITIDGHKLQVKGDAVGMEKLTKLIEPSVHDSQKKILQQDTAIMKFIPKESDIVFYPKNGEDPVFFVVDQMPEFPDGQLALRNYIAHAVKYPAEAKKNGIQGKVYVNFVVEKDGSIGDVKVARGVDPILDKEAIRVVSELPKWKPGKKKGQVVRVSYTVPINFALQ